MCSSLASDNLAKLPTESSSFWRTYITLKKVKQDQEARYGFTQYWSHFKSLNELINILVQNTVGCI